MKIKFINHLSAEPSEINKLLLENSVELKSISDLDILIEKIADAKYVMLGEASHGTHEYYTWRTHISKKLIEKKGFSFIAVEGDWPDCYRINRYIKGYENGGKDAYEVLHTFNRWPTWMWANWEVVALTEWLHKRNKLLNDAEKTGFYGLDVYSLWESLDAIINYLEKKDPETKRAALEAVKCFEPYKNEDGQSYAFATLIPESCEQEVVRLLAGIRKNLTHNKNDPESELNAEQNAYVAVNAEKYYRTMINRGPESWNIRDHHMADTLNRLVKFHGKNAKAIIWEHNTHIGDARATDMAKSGMTNLGQIVNENNSKQDVYSVGFGTYKGTVVAGTEWGDVMRIMNVPGAEPGSWEYLLHHLNDINRIVFMNERMKHELKGKFNHRAIGVVYHPKREHLGNYVPSIMSQRYDAFIFLDKTTALHPLHIETNGHLIPETFPFGV
jgi:erythromycin esterase